MAKELSDRNGAHLPLVSIVSPTLNQADFLEETLESVRTQDYPEIEHIVVDGQSTDGTLEILEKRKGGSLRFVSEADSGQAAAINRGISLARGEILAWLNTDDTYEPGAIRRVVAFFSDHPDARFVYGDALAIDHRGRRYGRRVNVGPCDRSTLVNVGDSIVQPAAFWKADLWRDVGPLDETLSYALDYEYWMRAAEKCHLHYLPVCLARERIHADAKTFKDATERIREIERVAVRHGGQGLPRKFRGEAGAALVLCGLTHCVRGSLRRGVSCLRQGLGATDSLAKTALYLMTALILGRRRIARARLWSNVVRARWASAIR